ncbi:hypothetical protein BKA65DRAFT_214620 [Rhexocercosporidium sp. MPI-PUGE-AT-0058]|nr:hypothetical protein BKA65DRAFT_214620 [Rhexocercosporidium sp. MPI-PUGE-AT-0058]
MSLWQLSTAMNLSPPPGELDKPEWIHLVLIYDFPVQFKKQFPTAVIAGVGLIPGWEFHINQKGRANIRPAFDTRIEKQEPYGTEYLLPAPAVKTPIFNTSRHKPLYGLIFMISKHDDQIIERNYAQQKQARQRVWSRAWLSRTGAYNLPSASVTVSMFADLRHTCNRYGPGGLSSAAELKRWEDTLTLFGKWGVPDVYRHFVAWEVQGHIANKISPIYIDPLAYPLDIFRIPLENPRDKVPKNAAGKRLSPRTAELKEEYYRKHGALAPAFPANDHQARIFEDYHDELMRGQVDVDCEDAEILQATLDYWDRMSARCDDGLDVLDAIKASRGQRPWRHPNTVDGPAEDGDMNQAAVHPPQKPASTVVSRKPSTAVKRKQPPKNAQVPTPHGPSPAKKQKVQQPKAAATAVPKPPNSLL